MGGTTSAKVFLHRGIGEGLLKKLDVQCSTMDEKSIQTIMNKSGKRGIRIKIKHKKEKR
jgi:hypothetical protein